MKRSKGKTQIQLDWRNQEVARASTGEIVVIVAISILAVLLPMALGIYAMSN